jgi:hypothetical protein
MTIKKSFLSLFGTAEVILTSSIAEIVLHASSTYLTELRTIGG